jgi:phosphoglycolate phosphatase
MKAKKKTVVFDWNGTLLADSAYVYEATNAFLKRCGKGGISKSVYQNSTTIPLMEMYEKFGCTEADFTEESLRFWSDVYHAKAETARLRRGAKEALMALREKDYALVILSNYIVEKIKNHTERFGVAEAFDAILANGAISEPMKKGKIERLEAYLEKQGRTQGMIVGDTIEEIEIGRAHGLATVAITDGVCSTARLRAARPDYLIGSLAKLPKIAEEMFG